MDYLLAKMRAILYLLRSPPPPLGPAIYKCQPFPALNLALGPRLLEVIPGPLFCCFLTSLLLLSAYRVYNSITIF
jgi:hypothetical protein